MERSRLAAVMAALLLPPLGIYLDRGIGPGFWIGTALTILFWIPGIIFALALVLNPRLLAQHA